MRLRGDMADARARVGVTGAGEALDFATVWCYSRVLQSRATVSPYFALVSGFGARQRTEDTRPLRAWPGFALPEAGSRRRHLLPHGQPHMGRGARELGDAALATRADVRAWRGRLAPDRDRRVPLSDASAYANVKRRIKHGTCAKRPSMCQARQLCQECQLTPPLWS